MDGILENGEYRSLDNPGGLVRPGPASQHVLEDVERPNVERELYIFGKERADKGAHKRAPR
ncbi:hypothetical protein Hypma_010761 [Hypsizygus marmoreus]|uniref:Uncharacterized protein n=1 Tax=Hypsizygus marmoreus TaxID=39966 RepID=A0A369JU05_HYPMA|nr:hypothetical protein Hypma_010761 [Hypsizygus marmoreus]